MIVLIIIPSSFASEDVAVNDTLAIDDGDVMAVEESEDPVVLSEEESATPVVASTSADLEILINNSVDGNVDLGVDTEYVFDNPVTVSKKINFTGTNVTFKGNGSAMKDGILIFDSDSAGSSITGVSFVNIDDVDNPNYKYNNKNANINPVTGKSKKTSEGIAINLEAAANNILIDNCQFYNWFNVGVSVNSANFATIQNSRFYGGSATYINNNPDGAKDRGTYDISVMGSSNLKVLNCLFDGPVCDGVSIAGGSSNAVVAGNTFSGNAFAMYFGGASSSSALIENNTFINCGWFESPIYDVETGNETGEMISWQNLPVISLQKSCSYFTLRNNTFNARTGNILVGALEGSTAHGGSSPIGALTITENTVEGLIGAEMPTVVLVEIKTKNAEMRPVNDMIIVNNTLNGARAVSFWSEIWGDENGDVTIPKATPYPTVFVIDSVVDGTISGVLKDATDFALEGKTISYTINGTTANTTTAAYGAFVIENAFGNVQLVFAGDNSFAPTECEVVVPAVPAPPEQVNTTITVSSVSIKAGDAGKFVITLKDANNNTVDAPVTVIIDGTTQSVNLVNGTASVDVKYASAGTHSVVVSYAGDKLTKSAIATSKITVSKKNTSITAPKASAKVNKAVKIKITLKSGKTLLSGKKITIKVNGKTFSGKTNSKGVASISVKVAKKGTFKYTATFAGDSAYNKSTKTASIVVKK